MNVLMIVLRIIHIFSAVFWAGTTFFFVSFLQPSVAATAPASNKVMGYLIERTGYISAIGGAAALAALSGIIMYWRGYLPIALTTAVGLGFTLGGVCGLAAAAVGLFVARPAAVQMRNLGMQMQSAGGPPSPEQMGQMKTLSEKLASAARITAILLVLAMLGMASARYLG